MSHYQIKACRYRTRFFNKIWNVYRGQTDAGICRSIKQRESTRFLIRVGLFPNPVIQNQPSGGCCKIFERLERLEEDKKAVLEDMKEVFAEAKGEGYDIKILRKVIRMRKQDQAKRQEEEAILDLYLSALGEL